jgi:hypothetical protein
MNYNSNLRIVIYIYNSSGKCTALRELTCDECPLSCCGNIPEALIQARDWLISNCTEEELLEILICL